MNKYVLIALYAILACGFLGHYILVGQAVYGDGIYYWMLTRSIGTDHDLYLNDEYSHHYSWTGNNTNEKPAPVPKETAQLKRIEFHLPIGPSLAWLPWFFLADGIAHIVSLFNSHILTNGYSDIYQITVGLGVLIYVMFGVYVLFKLLTDYFSPKVSYLALLIVLFASNLFYYTSLDILNSHPISFTLSCIYLLLINKLSKKPSIRSAFLTGLVFGLMAITRTQDSLFLIAFLISLYSIYSMQHRLLPSIKILLAFGTGTFLTSLPQMAIWYIFFGGALKIPYVQHANPFDFLHPHLLGVLFNLKTGMFIYSPILLICIFGLYYLLKKYKIIGIMAITIILLEFYLIASWEAWDQAASYGIRMMISCMPFFMLGLAAIIDYYLNKYKRAYRSIVICGVFFVVVNLISILMFQLFIKDQTLDLGHNTKLEHLQKLNQWLHL